MKVLRSTNCIKHKQLVNRSTRCRVHVTATSEMSQPKSVLITGGNTGIGFETAKALAKSGYQTIIACRDVEKGKAAKAKLLELVPGSKIELVNLDLANLQSIRDFSNRALDFGKPLDILINNAGVSACPAMTTSDGFEYQLGVNHLGHFLLTTMLMPLMTQQNRPTRIINVSSTAHYLGHMNFDDIMCTHNYQPWIAYAHSKLANVLFTYELARRLPSSCNMTVNSLHPGFVNTELSRYWLDPNSIPLWQRPLFQLMAGFLITPPQGAATSIYLATSQEVEGVTSKYFDDCKPKTSSKESYDAEVARRLWDLSCELTKADVTIPSAVSV